MKKTIKIFKTILPLLVIFTMLAGFITVSASSYKTTLELGPGHHLTGSTRYYTAGKPELEVNINYFVKYKDQNYSWMYYEFISSDNTVMYSDTIYLSPYLLGKDARLLNNATSVKAGNYKWYFSTLVDGQTYSGFYMDPVYLTTK